MNFTIILILFIYLPSSLIADNGKFSITRIQYRGGGDWYSDQSSIPNLLEFVNKNTGIPTNLIENKSRIGDDIFIGSDYLYLTGHGNIKFSDEEIIILRNHILSGAFLHADDNYGMDESFRSEMKKVFPELNFLELPNNHPIYHNIYEFNNGLPKIHEHDNKPAQGLALIYNNKIICYYSYESDLGDGWEDISVHKDPEYIREKALKMGANIISYAMNPTK